MAESIAHHRDLAELFHDLAARLHDVAHFDYLNLVLHDPERQVMRLHLLETLREKPTQLRVGLELPIGLDAFRTAFSRRRIPLSFRMSKRRRRFRLSWRHFGKRASVPSAWCP